MLSGILSGMVELVVSMTIGVVVDDDDDGSSGG